MKKDVSTKAAQKKVERIPRHNNLAFRETDEELAKSRRKENAMNTQSYNGDGGLSIVNKAVAQHNYESGYIGVAINKKGEVISLHGDERLIAKLIIQVFLPFKVGETNLGLLFDDITNGLLEISDSELLSIALVLNDKFVKLTVIKSFLCSMFCLCVGSIQSCQRVMGGGLKALCP